MDESNSFLIPGNVAPITHHSFLMRQPQYSGQSWFNIDEEVLAKTMRWVYDNPKGVKEITTKALQDIKEKWTWEKTAFKIHSRLLEVNTLLDDGILLKNKDSLLENVIGEI